MRVLIAVLLAAIGCAADVSALPSVDDPGPADIEQPGERAEELSRCGDVLYADFIPFLQATFPGAPPAGDAGAYIPNTSCRQMAAPGEPRLFYRCKKGGTYYGWELTNILSNGFLSVGYMDVSTYRSDAEGYFRTWGAPPYRCMCNRSPKCVFWGLVLP